MDRISCYGNGKILLWENEKIQWKYYWKSALKDLLLSALWEFLISMLENSPTGGITFDSENTGRGMFVCPIELEALTKTTLLALMSIL